MKKAKILVLILLTLISLTGCARNKTAKVTKSEEEKFIAYENAIALEEVREAKANLIDAGKKYEANTKTYYEELKAIKTKNDFTNQFEKLYEKLDYDNLSKIEKDFLDYNVWWLFASDISENYEITKAWKIGYDGYTNTTLSEKEYTALVFEYKYGDKTNYYFMAMNNLKTDKTKLRTVVDYSNKTSWMPIDPVNDNGTYKNQYKDEATSSFDGEKYGIISSDELAKLNTKFQTMFNFITKYQKDYNVYKEKHAKCNTRSAAISVAEKSRNYNTYMYSVKGKFHKVNRCEQTNTSVVQEDSDNYVIQLSGTCNGYTDVYNDDFNIAYYDIKIAVSKFDCETTSKGLNVDLKY